MKESNRWTKQSYSYFLMLSLAFFVITFTVVSAPGSLMHLFGINAEAEAAVTLKNPNIEVDSSMKSGQKVTYDCIWFGSYPQTEIVDQASSCGGYEKSWLTEADYEINSSLYNSLSKLDGWDSNNDIAYQGSFYHRMKKEDAFESNSGANYYDWKDENTYHYFRYDKIKWRVLNVENGKALLFADQVIDAGYYTTNNQYTWENCSSRAWLNDFFINKAFLQEEQTLIQITSLVNKDDTNTGSEEENDTEDKVFYLSESDVSTDTSLVYGFAEDGSLNDEARVSYCSTYTKARGLSIGATSNFNLRRASWRLRSPGRTESHPQWNRRCIGWLGEVGNNGYSALMGVRPAITISVSASDLYSYAGTICTDGTVNEVEYSGGNTSTYTVNYEANGGSETLARQIKTKGVNLVLSKTVPTRTGYTFLGWGTDSSTTEISYAPGATYSQDTDITLYAIWRKSITLSFNLNGGTGSIPSVTGYAYNAITSCILPITSTEPTRSGYKFLGWSKSSSATSASYAAADQITLSSDTTLYAVWEAMPTNTYSVTYNANGGTGAPASQTKTEGITLALSSSIPERAGYTFMGWGTSSSATTVSYEPGASYSQDADITLYAIWQKPVTLTMHPNGGMIGNAYQTSTIMYLYNAETGKTFIVSTAVEPSREGYDFVGWNEDSGAKTASYQKGDTIILSSDKTLYAIWRKGITLTYNGNGGSGAPSAVTGYLYNAETSYSFTISNTTPERSGYNFLGWSKEEGSDSASYKAGNPVSLTSNTTLYAVWEAIPAATYTVTYDANGGTGAPASQTKTDGVDLTLSSVTPKRDGYTFAGWGTGSSSTVASYSAGSSYTKNANLTLYAIWKKTLTLAYNANGGSGIPASQSGTVYNNVSEYTFTISNTEPSWEGHSFIGWGTSADATSTYGSGEDITVNENTTLYAIWKVLPTDEKVTLTYSNANGGENIPASRTVDKGSVVNLSGLHPTKEGYQFLGWSSNREATSASYAPGDTVDLTSDLTLYAIWVKTITLSYHANGGIGQPETASKTIYNTATRATFSIDRQTPERDNYTFLGWNNDDNATSAAYAPGDAIDLSSNLTLYAVWKAKPEGGDTPGDDPTTDDPSDSETKPIVKKNQTITASNKTVAIKSSPFKLGARTSGDGKLTYASSAKSVATISAAGVVTARNYGETIITIKAAATSAYKACTKKIKISVVPKKMILKSAKAVSNRGIKLKWSKDKTATGYEVQICLRKDFKSGAYQRFYKMSTVTKKITNLKKKTWYIRIRAYRKVGKKTYNGIWSNIKKAKVK